MRKGGGAVDAVLEYIVEYLCVFCATASAGWLVEVIYRGIRHRKVVNPGFLTGCCLPLYGVGGMILYFLSGLKLRGLPNEPLRVAVILILGVAVMTLIELVAGFISVQFFRVRLWDYSGEWMNFRGLICPKFTFFGAVICAVYYFLIYPFAYRVARGAIEVPALILAVGVYVGVFTVDLFHSLHIMQYLRRYAVHMKTLVNIDRLKSEAKEYFKQKDPRRHVAFHFYRMVGRYLNESQNYREQIHRKWGGEKNETDRTGSP